MEISEKPNHSNSGELQPIDYEGKYASFSTSKEQKRKEKSDARSKDIRRLCEEHGVDYEHAKGPEDPQYPMSRNDRALYELAKKGVGLPYDLVVHSSAVRRAMEQSKAIKRVNPYSESAKKVLELYRKRIFDEGKIGHTITVFIGSASSGKSTAINLLGTPNGVTIDSDDVKKYFHRYGKGEGAAACHVASGKIKDEVLSDAMAAGININLPIVGANKSSIEHVEDLCKQYGYKARIVLVKLPKDKCIARNFMRMVEDGRYVPFSGIEEKYEKPIENLEEMKERIKNGYSAFNSYAIVSTDVDKGQNPEVLEDSAE